MVGLGDKLATWKPGGIPAHSTQKNHWHRVAVAVFEKGPRKGFGGCVIDFQVDHDQIGLVFSCQGCAFVSRLGNVGVEPSARQGGFKNLARFLGSINDQNGLVAAQGRPLHGVIAGSDVLVRNRPAYFVGWQRREASGRLGCVRLPSGKGPKDSNRAETCQIEFQSARPFRSSPFPRSLSSAFHSDFWASL